MELNKIEKRCITGVVILVVIALCCNIPNIMNYFAKIKNISKKPTNSLNLEYAEEFVALPKDIKKISDKFDGFTEIYNSSEPVIVYGYDPLSVEEVKNRFFHKKLNRLLEKNDIKIKVIPYEKWEDALYDVQEKNGKDARSCNLFSEDEKELKTLIDTTENCFMNACVIDPQNNRYALTLRDAGTIVRTAEELLK